MEFVRVLTCFYRSPILEPFHLEGGVSNGFKSGFKVSKAAFADVELILDGASEHGWCRALGGLHHAAVLLLRMVSLQLLHLLNVTLLLRNTQVSCHAATSCNMQTLCDNYFMYELKLD